MRYLLKTDGVEFEIAKPPVPKTDQNGVQRIDRLTQWPQYVVGLMVLNVEEETAEDMAVTLASPVPPVLRWREPVSVVGLEMIPWASTDNKDRSLRSGVAFRAAEIVPAG